MTLPPIIIGYLVILGFFVTLQYLALLYGLGQICLIPLVKKAYYYFNPVKNQKPDSKELPLIEFHDYVNL